MAAILHFICDYFLLWNIIINFFDYVLINWGIWSRMCLDTSHSFIAYFTKCSWSALGYFSVSPSKVYQFPQKQSMLSHCGIYEYRLLLQLTSVQGLILHLPFPSQLDLQSSNFSNLLMHSSLKYLILLIIEDALLCFSILVVLNTLS